MRFAIFTSQNIIGKNYMKAYQKQISKQKHWNISRNLHNKKYCQGTPEHKLQTIIIVHPLSSFIPLKNSQQSTSLFFFCLHTKGSKIGNWGNRSKNNYMNNFVESHQYWSKDADIQFYSFAYKRFSSFCKLSRESLDKHRNFYP